MKRSIYVDLCAIMFLAIGASYAGDKLGEWIMDNSEYEELVRRNDEGLARFRQQQNEKVRESDERAAAQVEAILRAWEPAMREYDEEVARLRTEYEAGDRDSERPVRFPDGNLNGRLR